MTEGPSAKTWDAHFTAEAFDDAPAQLLGPGTWNVGVAPDIFLPATVQSQASWQPGSGTTGHLRFLSSVIPEITLYPGKPVVVQVDDIVVGRATIRSVTNERYRKPLHPGVVELEWWIMDCGLPDLIWARLRSWTDGSADVLTTGGALDRFPSKDDAISWLSEDEFRDLEVFNQGEFAIGTTLPLIWAPDAESDAELAPMMFQHWRSDVRIWSPTQAAG